MLRAHWRASREDVYPAAGEIADPWDDVVDRLDSVARVREIASALRGLPREEREVLLLVAWEQLTPTQAAVALGIPPGTARSRLHRARAALRALLIQDKP